MSLYKSMIAQGHKLFRWRSYIPLLFIGPLLLAFEESAHMETIMGERAEDLWVLFSFVVGLAGLGVRWLTVGFVPGGTSGRNTQDQRAEALNTSGMYSIVRNPLYLGNYIVILGVLLSIKVWWLLLLVSLGFFIYMERIILTEEDFLEKKFGADYTAWRARTPAIVPDFRLWRKPALPFSFRTVMKREYQGLLGMATAFLVTEFICDVMVENEPFSYWLREDMAWPVTYGVILAFCLTLRYLKKHTDFLKVEGR